MRALVITLLLSFGWAAGAHGQNAPTLQWTKRVGVHGTAREREREHTILRLSNNRLVVLGHYSSSSPPPNPGIIRQVLWYFNQRGDSIRTAYYTALPNEEEGPLTAAALPNGDMLLVGIGFTMGNNPDVWHSLIRLDSLGNVRWRRQYNRALYAGSGSTPYEENQNFPPLLLPDGGVLVLWNLVTGRTNSSSGTNQTAVARVDSVGNLLWQRTYGLPYSALYSMAALDDGSYALAGHQLHVPAGQQRLTGRGLLIRIDLDGNVLRSSVFGGATDATGWVDVKGLPNANVLLAGGYQAVPYSTTNPGQGLLAQLDSTDQPVWTRYVSGAQPFNQYGASCNRLELVQGNDFVVQGWRYQTAPGVNDKGYLARWHLPTAPGGQPTPAWELQFPDARLTSVTQTLWPDGSLTVGTKLPTPPGADPNLYYHPQLRHYAGVGRPAYTNLCATPPQANAAFVLPPAAPDSLNLLDLGSAGPRYARLVHWRWELGDGTSVVRTSPGWVRHRYASIPPPGTPVRVTVTNNLGCTSTQVLYPWGRPTAMQQARALAQAATLHPNPATGRATLTLPAAPAGPVRVTLLNALGQRVGQYEARGGGVLTQALELGGLAPGVYAVRVRTSAGSFAKRLVVE